jgi:membrane protein implicated in regulation of membrane protease activity
MSQGGETVRTLEYVALVLIAAGILGMIGWGAGAFFTDPEVPLWLRVLAGIASVGFVMLLVYVVWDRIHKARTEPKDIKEVKH